MNPYSPNTLMHEAYKFLMVSPEWCIRESEVKDPITGEPPDMQVLRVSIHRAAKEAGVDVQVRTRGKKLFIIRRAKKDCIPEFSYEPKAGKSVRMPNRGLPKGFIESKIKDLSASGPGFVFFPDCAKSTVKRHVEAYSYKSRKKFKLSMRDDGATVIRRSL